ncbi:hypothetical protein BJ508DRAFT_303264 [Ascobolus immersus RN42]|uniref:F-box domain-containing protein n=1 Tax=Ascobolus immersus RN42 TaxID=1160509 RepID=A0A3N4ITC0_ASCIM|nr:hypothetical protein BJ508DRAFT_303264 [Ascobolus immersus RN42]
MRPLRQSPLELLPFELKLEVLLLTDFPTLFKLCAAAPSFYAVYYKHLPLLQRTLIRRYHTKESIELLDRFRPGRLGMDRIQTAIFASFHSWIDQYQSFQCFEWTTDLENIRKGLGTTQGIVGSLEEALLVIRLEEYAAMLYKEARDFGYHTPLHDFTKVPPRSQYANDSLAQALLRIDMSTPGDQTDDDPETRGMVRRALLQFMIMTAYYHDKSFAEEYRPAIKNDPILLRRCVDLKRYSWQFSVSRNSNPTIYDCSYVRTLSVSDVATVLSVVAPILHHFYSPPSKDSPTGTGRTEGIRDFWAIRLFHLRSCFPSGFLTADTLSGKIDFEVAATEEAQSLARSYSLAVSTGAWRSSYKSQLDTFQNAVETSKGVEPTDRTNRWLVPRPWIVPRQILFSVCPRNVKSSVLDLSSAEQGEYHIHDILDLMRSRPF